MFCKVKLILRKCFIAILLQWCNNSSEIAALTDFDIRKFPNYLQRQGISESVDERLVKF